MYRLTSLVFGVSFALSIAIYFSCNLDEIETQPGAVKAGFHLGNSGTLFEDCPVSFVNTSTEANSYLWDFGGGQTSTEQNPTHVFTEPGIYTVTLTAQKNTDKDIKATHITIYQSARFQKTYDSGSHDFGTSMVQSSDGGYTIIASTEGKGAGEFDIHLFRTNENGEKIWEKTFGGGQDEFAGDILQTADGGYVIAGSTESFGAGNFDIFLIRTDASGGPLWQKTYGSSKEERGSSILLTSDGGYLLTGITHTAPDSSTVYRTDANGTLVRQKTFAGAFDLVQTSAAGYALYGNIRNTLTGNYDARLIRLNNNEEILWEKTYTGNSKQSYARDAVEASNGGFILINAPFNNSGDFDINLIRVDDNGGVILEKSFGTSSDSESGFSIQETPLGGYVIAGSVLQQNGIPGTYLIRTNNNGVKLWEKTYIGGPGLNSGSKIILTRDCGFGIIGTSGGSNFNVFFVKTDADGNAQ